VSARLAIALALGLGACGDNRHIDDLFEPVSGSRLKLEWHLYEDGTRQAETAAFYDLDVHARCTPQRWIDDVIRCVPIAEDAIYLDPTCESLVGRAQTIEKPTHFIAHDTVAGTTLPARLFRAGPTTTPVTQRYELRDGECVGPFSTPSDLTYYQLVAEIAGWDLIALRDDEVGAGRLALAYRATDDGLRVPSGLRDRDLDLPCTPTPGAGGGFRCAPTEAATPSTFRDPACEQAVITVPDGAAVPTIAMLADPSGCARYHAVGGEVTGPLYRRDGEACTRVTPTPPPRQFPVAAELELPILERTIEDTPGRRLQRIILGDDELRFVDDRLHDTATRADCLRRSSGEVTRCLPAVIASATRLRPRSCAVEVLVAEIPQHTCERIGFATAITEEQPTIHAIGDRAADTLYQLTGGGCLPYPGAPGNELRTLGPPIAPETFPAAVRYGER